MEAADKWEAIEVLVDRLIAAHELRLTDRGEVLAAVTARERSLSTGLEQGLAGPRPPALHPGDAPPDHRGRRTARGDRSHPRAGAGGRLRAGGAARIGLMTGSCGD